MDAAPATTNADAKTNAKTNADAPAAPVAALLARSHRLGADPRNTNYAGGNTSVKGRVPDPVTLEPVDLVWVKGSGGDLGTLTEAGLAVLRLDRLRAMVDVYPGVDREDEMVAAFAYCLHGPAGAAPTARRSPEPASATACCGCPGAAQASSSAWTSPGSGGRTRRPSG